MRTTIRLDDDLLREAKTLAAETDQTLTSIIEDALRERLERQRHQRRIRESVQLTTFKGNGLQPGVDLDNTAELLDLMGASDEAG